MTARSLTLAAALVMVLGCAKDDFIARELAATSPVPDPAPISTVDPAPVSTTDPAPISTTDPAPISTSTPPSPAGCRWSGAPVLADGTCTGTLSQRLFVRAACACGALTLGPDAATDGFDSRVAPWAPGGAGGDVGALTGLSSGGLLDVGGSLSVSGAGVSAGTTLRVSGGLEAAGPLAGSSAAVTVGGSARIGGDVQVSSLSVAGTLTTPPGAVLTGTITAASRVTAPVTVSPACPCAASDAVDVSALVALHRTTNDNASIGLAPGALTNVWTDTTLELPCGLFYLDQIQGGALVTLRATGSAALFVGGGLTMAGSLTIELAPGAELDLFVAGPVNLPATLRLGDPARPRALRLWLATPDLVLVPYGAQLAANVYAPAASVAASTPLDLYGAVLAGSLDATAPLRIHRDRAIGSAAATCGP